MAGNATMLALNATMRAVLWSGIAFNVTVQDVPIPTLQSPTDARVRITAAAICGTDLHTYHGIYGSKTPPWVMGHEGIGIVESVGSGVQHIQVGDTVIVPDVFNIGELNIGLAEPEGNFGRSPGLGPDFGDSHGCQSEYIVVPYADYTLWQIPEQDVGNFTKEIDYLFTSDIFATGWTALDFSGFEAGDTVAVFGAGPVGLLSAYSAILRGASRVYSVDHVPQRLQLAASIGAIPISLNGSKSVQEQILHYEPEGVTRSVDCVGFEAVNSQLTIQTNRVIMDMVAVTAQRGGLGGIGVYAAPGSTAGTPRGNTTSTNIEFPIVDFFTKGLTYGVGPVDVKLQAPYLTQLIATGKAQPGFIVSSIIGIEDAPEYYARFSQQRESKVIIRFP